MCNTILSLKEYISVIAYHVPFRDWPFRLIETSNVSMRQKNTGNKEFLDFIAQLFYIGFFAHGDPEGID
jgi:hypothetical protein